jgi:hypothetical protein
MPCPEYGCLETEIVVINTMNEYYVFGPKAKFSFIFSVLDEKVEWIYSRKEKELPDKIIKQVTNTDELQPLKTCFDLQMSD